MTTSTTLTIFFDGTFWVAVLEHIDEHGLRVARHIFGSKPSIVEIYEFVQCDYLSLVGRLSPPVEIKQRVQRRMNPKRQQRLIKKQMREEGVLTKSQEALRLQREANKQEKVSQTKSQREQLKQYKRERKIQKRKQKRQGH